MIRPRDMRRPATLPARDGIPTGRHGKTDIRRTRPQSRAKREWISPTVTGYLSLTYPVSGKRTVNAGAIVASVDTTGSRFPVSAHTGLWQMSLKRHAVQKCRKVCIQYPRFPARKRGKALSIHSMFPGQEGVDCV